MRTIIRTARDIALLIGRSTLGVVVIAHGWAKHTNGTDSTAAGFESWGVPLPTASAYFTTYLELAGGRALSVGLATPVAAVLLSFTMIGAVFTAHADAGTPFGFDAPSRAGPAWLQPLLDRQPYHPAPCWPEAKSVDSCDDTDSPDDNPGWCPGIE